MKQKPFHSSIIVFVCLGYVGGIVVSYFISIAFSVLFCLVCFLFGVLFFIRRKRIIYTVFIILAFVFGCVYTQSVQLKAPNDINNFYALTKGKEIILRGIIDSDVTYKKVFHTGRYSFTLKCANIFLHNQWQNTTGKVLVQMYHDADLQYGDYVDLTGKTHRPFEYSDNEHSSYVDYLKRRGIHLILSMKKEGKVLRHSDVRLTDIKTIIYPWRRKFIDVFNTYLTPNEAGIMRAVILGDRTQLPRHVKELFSRTGTSHVLAMSGLHVGAVAGIFMLVIRSLSLGYRLKNILLIVMLILFVFLTGMRPSIIRALIMTSLMLGGYIFEKESNHYNNVFLAAFIILLINPLYLFDIGFQLSFACIFSILFLMSIINREASMGELGGLGKLRHYFFDSLSVSTVIWIGVTGLTVLYFNIVTPVSIIVNLWAIPLIGIVVVLGLGMLLASIIFPVMIGCFAACLKVVLNFFVATLFLAEKVPLGYFYVKYVNIWYIIIYYIVIFVLGFFFVRRNK